MKRAQAMFLKLVNICLQPHDLRGGNQEILFGKWIKFWCNKPLRYGRAPETENNYARLNHSKGFPDVTRWSHAWGVYSKLGVEHDKRDDTNMLVFLSCWLWAFVPNKEGHFIRLGTFKMTSRMASGRKVTTAISSLTSIYNSLNKI